MRRRLGTCDRPVPSRDSRCLRSGNGKTWRPDRSLQAPPANRRGRLRDRLYGRAGRAGPPPRRPQGHQAEHHHVHNFLAKSGKDLPRDRLLVGGAPVDHGCNLPQRQPGGCLIPWKQKPRGATKGQKHTRGQPTGRKLVNSRSVKSKAPGRWSITPPTGATQPRVYDDSWLRKFSIFSLQHDREHRCNRVPGTD